MILECLQSSEGNRQYIVMGSDLARLDLETTLYREGFRLRPQSGRNHGKSSFWARSRISQFVFWGNEKEQQEFPGGPVVSNLPACAEDIGWEDSTCHGATKPMHHNYWSPHTLEPVLCNKGSRCLEKPKHCRESTRVATKSSIAKNK